MPTEYYLDEKLSQAVTGVAEDETFTELSPLRTNATSFLVAAMRKTNKDGDTVPTSGPPIVVRRIGPAESIFLEGFHYKLYVDIHRWDETNENQHRAIIHFALLRINVEVKETGVKYSIRRPDVETFQQNIVRFGAWEEPLMLLRENLANAHRTAAKLSAEMAGNNK